MGARAEPDRNKRAEWPPMCTVVVSEDPADKSSAVAGATVMSTVPRVGEQP